MYLRNAGWYHVTLGGAGLLLLQLWTIYSSTHRELGHFSSASPHRLGTGEVIALLGASRPFGPFSHITVFGYHTSLEGHRQSLLRAQAVEHGNKDSKVLDVTT